MTVGQIFLKTRRFRFSPNPLQIRITVHFALFSETNPLKKRIIFIFICFVPLLNLHKRIRLSIKISVRLLCSSSFLQTQKSILVLFIILATVHLHKRFPKVNPCCCSCSSSNFKHRIFINPLLFFYCVLVRHHHHSSMILNVNVMYGAKLTKFELLYARKCQKSFKILKIET